MFQPRPRHTDATRWDSWDRVIVLANRAPFRHEATADGRVVRTSSASGVVTALEPLVRSCGGTWVAHGSGSADRRAVDDRDGVNVPARDRAYRLRYVWLETLLFEGFYNGFSNEGLWPLCHDAGVAPVFRADDFRMYEIANARFASAVVHEARSEAPLVFVQDYHFALAPALLRRFMPRSTIVAFWHIPWPSPRLLDACPFADELLTGLLSSDVVGVQTSEDAEHFLSGAERILHATVDRSQRTVRFRGRSIRVAVAPVGVNPDLARVMGTPPPSECRAQLCRELGLPAGALIGVGVDRLDYTKGLAHKFLAIERLLEREPQFRDQLAFVQVAEPSREHLPAYRGARNQLLDVTARINARFGVAGHRPIHLIEAHRDADAVYRLYRAADACVVSSLHDGMNLVAKEFVAARDDERGVLVLSEFAGAARQLRAALPIDPRDIDQTAGVLLRALTMSPPEQAIRMRLLRANVRDFSAAWWAGHLIEAAASTESSTMQSAPVMA